jgi:LIVCS family branched-chain amino acid:cation transporter
MNRFKQYLFSETLMLGLAMFCMFFGAGNVIFPLYLGQICQEHFAFGFFGLFFTAVLMPFVGVFTMILFDGQTKLFFGRFGRWIGLFIATILMVLLGPFGSTPRCLALSYSSFKTFFPALDPNLFMAFVCIAVFFATKNRQLMMKILGRYITPILLLLLALIIGVGVFSKGESFDQTLVQNEAFIMGIKEGYNTMDLLAAFFFSSSIIYSLKRVAKTESLNKQLVKKAVYSSLIGAFLLCVTYLGFSYLAAKHTVASHVIPKEMILQFIMIKLVGQKAALIVAVVISLACLTTAMALLSVFVEFVQKECHLSSKSETGVLAISVIVTGLIARLEFTGISTILTPILQFLYPFLIALTVFHLFEKIWFDEHKRLQIFKRSSKL